MRRLAPVLLLAGLAVAAFVLLRDDSPPANPVRSRATRTPTRPDREQSSRRAPRPATATWSTRRAPEGSRHRAAVERFRADIERAADDAGVDPDLIEGMVLLESAGRPDAIASDDLEESVGLTQILAETATSLLDMHVDVAASERLTRRLARRAGRARRIGSGPSGAEWTSASTREVARRHRPLPEAREGRVRARGPCGGLVPHGNRQPPGRARRVRRRRRQLRAGLLRRSPDLPARLPPAHPPRRRLEDLSLARARLREVMRLYREDRPRLEAARTPPGGRAVRRAGAASAGPDRGLREHRRPDGRGLDGELRPFSNEPRRYGLRRSPAIEDELLWGLRPSVRARRIPGARRAPGVGHASAAHCHEARDHGGGRPRAAPHRLRLRCPPPLQQWRAGGAFQYMLDRLQALNLIAWTRDSSSIHITASGEFDLGRSRNG